MSFESVTQFPLQHDARDMGYKLSIFVYITMNRNNYTIQPRKLNSKYILSMEQDINFLVNI